MTLSEDHDDGSATFARVPNELKLMFAEELGIHDLIALARTCREMNRLLTRMIYRRAKDSKARCHRPYFLLAVDSGNLPAVKRFVEAGASMNMRNPNTLRLPDTAIHCCAYFGYVEIAEFLIDKGINVSAVDGLDREPLYLSVTGERPEEAMLSLLVKAGANVNARSISDRSLIQAARDGNLRIVQRLLDLGAAPNAPGWNGCRAVHKAASHGNAATVRRLLEAGRNVEIADNHGHTALHMAARYGRSENVKVLLEMGADVSSVNISGKTPLMMALSDFGNEASAHRILHLGASMVDRLSGTAERAARTNMPDCVPSCTVKEGNPLIIEILLAAGSDIAKRNRDGGSPLSWALASARDAIFRRAKEARLLDQTGRGVDENPEVQRRSFVS